MAENENMETNRKDTDRENTEAADKDTAQEPQTEGVEPETAEAKADTDGEEDAVETKADSEKEVEQADDKRGLRKKAKADKKQEALKNTISELEDKVKRQMAEFDNFRKRTEKEKTAMFETGAKSVIEKILPVVDNFERGLAAIPEAEKGSGFSEGMQMIYRQLMTELDGLGVRPIEAVGQEFNPDYHNAVMQVESEEYESGVIAQELQKGYMYRDSVVRHSMVAVVS